MTTTARQLKDLVRNLSKKKSADAQILMRNYMMERFLERISLSEYKRLGLYPVLTVMVYFKGSLSVKS